MLSKKTCLQNSSVERYPWSNSNKRYKQTMQYTGIKALCKCIQAYMLQHNCTCRASTEQSLPERTYAIFWRFPMYILWTHMVGFVFNLAPANFQPFWMQDNVASNCCSSLFLHEWREMGGRVVDWFWANYGAKVPLQSCKCGDQQSWISLIFGFCADQKQPTRYEGT